MGVLVKSVTEKELAPLVRQWRQANPRIIRLWAQVENAAVMAVRQRTRVRLGRLTFQSRSGMLLITLPSGRKLCYVKPRIQTNRFGGDGLTYEGNLEDLYSDEDGYAYKPYVKPFGEVQSK